MIIIYYHSKCILPQIACKIHLALPQEYTPARQQSPLTVMGIDKRGNTVCCLAYGRYRTVYLRAVKGISHMFHIHLCLIDVYTLLLTNGKMNLTLKIKIRLANFCPELLGIYLTTALRQFIPVLGHIKG